MSQAKKRRRPRITIPESTTTNWRETVHPFFVRMMEYNNQVMSLHMSSNEADRKEAQRLTRDPPPDLAEEALRMQDVIPPSDRPQHNAYLSIFGIAGSPEGAMMPEEDQVALGWLAFKKFGKSIVELIRGDTAGDEKSSRQLLSVQRDYQDWRYGKLDINKMRFKFDSHHIQIMQAGLELGFRNLSPAALADCVVEIMDRLAKNLPAKQST